MKVDTQLQTSYRPDIDISPEIKFEDGAYCQLLVRILIWIVDLGRIDICLEVSMMLSNLALPQ